MSEITTAARKMAKEHNKRIARGFAGNGKLVFGVDGSGGAWYSDNSYGFGSDTIVLSMRHGRITAADCQQAIDQNREAMSE
jgi:hypothetical protein